MVPTPIPQRRRGGRDWQDWLVLLWPAALAVVLVAPLLVRPGHPLARDLVFVPRQPFNDATWGLGEVAPRAVPLDSVVAALTHVVDGGVLARIVLPLLLALLGWGVARLLAPLGRLAQLAGSGFAVWNAYVVERLALGQWALLLACTALPWLVAAAMRWRREGRAVDLAAAVGWSALASLTPTGGLLAVGALVVATAPRTTRLAPAVLAGLALQAPWVAAALTGPGGHVSDGAGVAAFAPDTGSRFGPLVAMLGLGGIWDGYSEPASRTTGLALVAAAVVVLALVAGLRGLRWHWGSGDTVRWVVLAAAPAAVAFAAATGGGQDLLVDLVDTVPGAGLLRDTQKLLAPAVVLVSVAFGAAAARLWRAVPVGDARPVAALVLAALPVVVLPDATLQTWPTVSPVRFPADLTRVADRLAGEPGVVVTLPWRAYRAYDWTRPGQTASDPAVRMFDADVVTSDSLQVGQVLVPGESTLAAQIGQALEAGPPAEVLPGLGVAWVVVYPDDREAGQLDLTGLEPVVEGEHAALYRVPDAVVSPSGEQGSRALAVWAAHLLALLVATAAVGARVATRKSARRERDADLRVM
ncbi:hypothetical protein EUA93_17530 [Nocardioides oleivorans]|uniref:YfhO family protein n=1 Tax=Nocardioides oleivorans TaxID=273676 RepID=A0A4Q2RVI9_9ACTN|nr:hypothetical protein [Nocardioides oleivorans]RYB91925.1 hypothetical protein EUA93_17530 [Nocardioides oleivorans]